MPHRPSLRDRLRSGWSLFRLRRRARVGASPSVEGRVWIRGEGTVRIGDRVRIEAATAPVELHADAGAEVVIGDDVVIEAGVSVEAVRSVTIGDRARLGAYCKVLDNAFHALGSPREKPPSGPVVVEADAWIGRRAILLPGARVRSGITVRPAAVVRGRAEPARADAGKGGAA